jgi:hypothetical protein
MLSKVPTDYTTIKTRIDNIAKQATTLDNKSLASDLIDSLNNKYTNSAGRLGSFDFDKEFLPLHGKCANQIQDFYGMITDGGDTYSEQALEAGKKAFEKMTKDIREFSFETMHNLNKTLPKLVYKEMKPYLKKILNDKGYGQINTDEIFNKLDSSATEITDLYTHSEKEHKNKRKGIMDISIDIFKFAGEKIIQYTPIASQLVVKFSDLCDQATELLNDELSCMDIVNEVFDMVAPSLRTEIMNASLVNALVNNYNIPLSVVGDLTIDKAFDIEAVLKDRGYSIMDNLGNVQLSKLNGFIDAQESSQIVKAVTNSVKSSSDIVNADVEKQKIINTAHSVDTSISEMKIMTEIV